MDDILSEDAALFCDPDVMPGGESITYTPKGATPVTINANVFRYGPQAVSGQVIAPHIEIEIPNHATKGRTSINVGGDTVTLPERQGETAITLRVNQILQQDGGMWLLALE